MWYGLMVTQHLYRSDNELSTCGSSGLSCTSTMIARQECGNSSSVSSVTDGRKPMEGWIKCNVNAGFFDSEGMITAVSCFRNYPGQFILART